MQYVSIKIVGNMDLSERERAILQVTTLNFAAMTNALITREGIVINPQEEGIIGVILIYPKALDNEKAEEMKKSLENRFDSFFKMTEIELNAEIELS